MEQRPFGWRQLLGAVNLRDFADMVRGELGMIGSSLRRAVEALPHVPAGPLVFFGFLLLVVLRSVLLVLVVILFGTGILLISTVRGAIRMARRQGGDEGP